MSELMTKKEAAAHLRVSARTLDRYRAANLVRAVKLRGIVRLRRADLDNLLRKGLEG